VVDFNQNEFKGNRDVNININEQNNIGKLLSQCSNEELLCEQDFRFKEKKKRSKKLRGLSVKWFVWLFLGLLLLGYILMGVWKDMGSQLNFDYLFNIELNLVSVELDFFSLMLNILLFFLTPFILVAIPTRNILKNFPSRDKLFNKHKDALSEIKEILEERGQAR
jgi:hypothetical protein